MRLVSNITYTSQKNGWRKDGTLWHCSGGRHRECAKVVDAYNQSMDADCGPGRRADKEMLMFRQLAKEFLFSILGMEETRSGINF